MADANHHTIRRDDDSFAVEVTMTGALPQTVTGFAIKAEAETWIAQDRRLWEATDPFRGPAHSQRRGF